jgi:WD40 repeat protein
LAILSQASLGQEEYPPLVGPIVYGQPIHGALVFQDLGSGEVWEIDTETLIQAGYGQNWSPNGCHLLYRNRISQQYAVINVQTRIIEEIDLPGDLRAESNSFIGEPQWSPDGRKLAYGLFDGANTDFIAYDLFSGETEILYTREDHEDSYGAGVVNWRQENALVYENVDNRRFEVDLATGQIHYLLRDEIINIPALPPFTYSLRSPNNEAIASYFDLPFLRYSLDERIGWNNGEEREAIRQAVDEWSGMKIYIIDTGETLTFDLDDQLVSAAAWSPDGTRLAILTWPSDNYEMANGAYIYNSETYEISPVGNLRPVRHTDPGEYGYYQPSWSPNGEWLTLFSLDLGWVVYNLVDKSITQLAKPFQDTISIGIAPFGSITNYEPGACG